MRLVLALAAAICAAALIQPVRAQPTARPAQVAAQPLRGPASTTASTAAPTRALTREDLEPWLDGYMPYALQRGDIAGAVVVVVKDGKVLLEKGYGYADVAARTPVDPRRTIFRPGSVSKLFTWTAVMQQVEAGKLDLDRDVNAYLDFRIPPRADGPITLRHLLTHTAGFEDTVKGLITSDPKNIGTERGLKAFVPRRIYKAGTTPAYSNYGTALAGYIVERISGQSFDDYMDSHIFGPLGMTSSSFRQPLPPALLARVSKGYPMASAPPQPYEYVSLAPAGSLASTGSDMAKFMIAHLQGGAFGEGRILRPETARLMHDTPLTMVPPLNRMLLGFYESDVNGHRVIAHAGDTTLFHSDLNLFVDDGVGIFISMNSSGRAGAPGAIRGFLLQSFADRYFPNRLGDGTVDAKTAARHAAMVAGAYTLTRGPRTSFLAALGLAGGTMVTANPDGTITSAAFENLAGAPKQWKEIAPFVWREIGGRERLAAKVVDGKVVRIGVDSYSPYMVYDRMPAARSPAWIMPSLQLALAALGLTVALWPVAVFARRRYGAAFPLSGREAVAYRAVRIGSAAVLVALLAWAGTIAAMIGDSNLISYRVDGWLRTLQIVGGLVFAGAVLIALWNAWSVWRGRRSWFGKGWSLVLVAATSLVLYVAITFHLIGFDVNF